MLIFILHLVLVLDRFSSLTVIVYFRSISRNMCNRRGSLIIAEGTHHLRFPAFGIKLYSGMKEVITERRLCRIIFGISILSA